MSIGTPICGDCGASLGGDREGPCDAPGCTGHVSWEAAFDALSTTAQGAAAALQTIYDRHHMAGDGSAGAVSGDALRALGIDPDAAGRSDG